MSEQVGGIHYEVSMELGDMLNKNRRIQKELESTGKDLDSLNAKFSAVGKAVQGFIAGLAIAAVIQKIVTETRKAEQEQAQLSAVLKSTGESAGWTAEQLNRMAESMAKNSTYGAGDITSAMTRMLSYENVVGEQVPKAMQSTIDMAARLGMSLNQSAETIGKALNKPSEGMRSLSRQGFEFSDDQIALARKLESTGKIAQAQAIVFESLEFAYDGAALAARNTFGGAITALQNQLSDLLTADGKSLGSATKAVNDLTTVLGRSETKAAFDTITGWVVSLSKTLVTAVTNLTAFITSSEKLALLTGTDKFSKASEGAKRYGRELKSLTDKAIQMQGEIEMVSADLSKEGKTPSEDKWVVMRTAALAKLRVQIDEVQKKAQGATQDLKTLVNGDVPLPVVAGSTKPTKPPSATGAKAAEDAAKKAAREAEAERKRRAEEAKSYIKGLDEQLTKSQDLNTYEKLMVDVKKGHVHLTEKQLGQAQGLATLIDKAKELQEEVAQKLNIQNAEYSAQRDLLAQINGYQESLNAMTMSDRAAQDMQNRLQITERYLDRIRELEDQQRNALSLTTDDSKKAGIKKQYDDLIAIQVDYRSRSLAEYDKSVVARLAKETNWSAGVEKSLANYLESARNTYSQAQSAADKAFQGMEDALVNFAMTGKLEFKSLIDSLLADMARAEAKKFLSGVMGGKNGGGLASIIGSFFGSFSTGGYTGDGGKYEPKGVVHGGEYVINKDATNRLGLGFLDRLNGFSSGGYVGAVPTPGSASASANAGAGGLTIQTNVSIPSEGGGKAGADVQQNAKSLSKLIDQRVREVVDGEMRQGGSIWRMKNGY